MYKCTISKIFICFPSNIPLLLRFLDDRVKELKYEKNMKKIRKTLKEARDEIADDWER